MWPFKKPEPRKEEGPKFQTVICIPGNWLTWEEFILKIVEATNGKYLAAGKILMNAPNKKHYLIEFCERDEKMKHSFEVAGMVTGVSKQTIEEIDRHTSVIYISGDTGNAEDARFIALAAAAILKAGGIAVKVETTGVAFNKDRWLNFADSNEDHTLYEMYVVDSITDEKGTVFSCGMQNIGQRDTIVSGLPFQEAVDLIRIFGYFRIIDKPILREGETFSANENSPRFRISEEPNQPYANDDLFENPFGMWRLTAL